MMSEKKMIAQNKKATHDYFIDDVFEAGIVLTGTEIKSIRDGKVQLKDSYVRILQQEAFWIGGHIAAYDFGNRFNHDETRTRKLLLHRKEINKLIGHCKDSGVTLIPLSLYLKDGKAKLELALARGKKNYDKRETLKQKDASRDIQRALREREKG